MRAPEERRRMVRTQVAARGVRSLRVLGALLRVDRRLFVPAEAAGLAFGDHPVAIGSGQTVSQPYMAALMLEALDPHRGLKVLEVGAGSGYVLALLKAMGLRPLGVEVLPALEARLRENLARAGAGDVPVRIGDGGSGWPEEAPFHRVLVSAACPAVPPPLLAQLAPGGVLVAPVAVPGGHAVLRLTKRRDGSVETETLDRCVFVPLVGAYGESRS